MRASKARHRCLLALMEPANTGQPLKRGLDPRFLSTQHFGKETEE